MPPPDIGTIRENIRTRLQTLDAPLKAYARSTGTESETRSLIVRPQPPGSLGLNPRGGRNFQLTGQGGGLQYDFLIEIWVGLRAGEAKAQEILDSYLSPTGTNDNSIEGKLEQRDVGDALDTNTSSIAVGPFTRYVYGGLNSDDVNCLYASVPVSVLIAT